MIFNKLILTIVFGLVVCLPKAHSYSKANYFVRACKVKIHHDEYSSYHGLCDDINNSVRLACVDIAHTRVKSVDFMPAVLVCSELAKNHKQMSRVRRKIDRNHKWRIGNFRSKTGSVYLGTFMDYMESAKR